MSIQVLCNACRFKLEIPDEFAGKKAKCGNCGAAFRVPSSARSPSSPAASAAPSAVSKRLLSTASLEEIVAEVKRRGRAALLATVDLSKYGVHSLADLLDSGDHLGAGLSFCTTEPLDAESQQRLLAVLGDGLKRLSNPAAAAEQDAYYEPFDFKGDPLGMTLAEFKHKYARDIPGSSQPAPFCSDRGGGFRIPELHTEAWHNAAGIVHARIELPSEHSPPSFAGVASELLLYQFLDGRLFQITALFPSEGFPMVTDAIRRKYGPPSAERQEPRQLEWKRMASTIELTNGRISPPSPSQLRIYYDDLLDEALSREPRVSEDI